MTLKDKFIRFRLMDRHRQLACGSGENMAVARNILELLNTGKLYLDLSAVSWLTECELSKAGILVCYSSRGIATAHVAK